MNSDLLNWLESDKHLPVMLRDFHDRKDLFKSMYTLYRDSPSSGIVPSPYVAHVCVVDWFLWYMASRGYTLQKSRKRVPFRDHLAFNELVSENDLTKSKVELDVCPFCSCKMRVESNRDWHKLKGDHEQDCFFEYDREDSYPATKEGLEELFGHWNKRG